MLKILNIKNIVAYTRWKTTDFKHGVTRPILNLTLSVRPL